MRRCSLFLLPFLVAGPLTAAEGGAVAPGQKIAELLSPVKESAGASPRDASGGSISSRLLVAAGALLVLGAALLVARRRRSRFVGALAIEPVDVVGRAALSPRHSIYVVRAAGRRIVLGVAGERMTALTVIEDRAAEPAPPPAQGYTSRVSEPNRRPTARNLPPADLEPYRKQVDRLRGMLRPPFRGGSQGGPEED